MRVRTTSVALALLAILSESMAADPLTEEDAAKVAADAYVYGYPLVLMDVTRQVMTAVPKAGEHQAPVNQFVHLRTFPDASFTDVVSPNADTLYSSAWLDLSQGPIVLSLPAMGKRYYLMPMLDGWSNVFASPGTRTTGNGKGDFAIVGPTWTGELSAGLREIRSPTNIVWLLGRTQTNGEDDYPAVHAIQDQYKLTPLSAWGQEYAAPVDVPVEEGVDAKTAPVEQVAKMDAKVFFARLNALMKDNPPADADAGAVKRLEAVGVAPGKAFDLTELDPAIAKGIEGSVPAAQAKLVAAAKAPQGRPVNGWDMMYNLGRYGTDYPLRAVVALVGLGANLPEDAIYPLTRADAAGQVLSGAKRYVIQFPKGQLPPVGAFWSVSMYNSKQFFVENPIGRYAIGDRDKLKLGDDESLTLFIQHEPPGAEQESNWLPAPKEEFNLLLRLYWPKQEILDGTWTPPAVKRVEN